jgi:type VI secretion system protein ImpC
MADLSGQPDEPLPKLKDRKFLEIDQDNFNERLKFIKPRVAFKITNTLTDDTEPLEVELRFKSIDDFSPERVSTQVAQLDDLLALRTRLADLRSALNYKLEDLLHEVIQSEEALNQVAAELASSDLPENGTLEKIVAHGRVAQSEDEGLWPKEWIETFFNQLLDGSMVFSRDIETMLTSRIHEIDGILSKQLNEIMHAPDSQRLEATWRGLEYLVTNSETSDSLKIRVYNVTKRELLREFEKAIDPDLSTLFRKIYKEEFGMFGGSPYSLLIGDYYFDGSPQDIELLTSLSNLAAAAHAAFIAAPHPGLFGLESFTELGDPRFLEKIFQGPYFRKWRSFRDSENARSVAIVLPRMLLRLPYGKSSVPVTSFDYEEDIGGSEHEKFLWGNSACALGMCIAQAFAKYRWYTAIRGVESGGLVEDLPLHVFETVEGDLSLKCPTEIAIVERREKELAHLGFVSLIYSKGSDYAAFFSTPTVHKPRRYDTDFATSDARLSSRLEYVLTKNRFAHYLKCIMRDKIGSFMTRENAEDFLNQWIGNYVLKEDKAGQEMEAKFPLREARVELKEIPGRPGTYSAVVFLKPHYQLDELNEPLRMVVELPPFAQ